MATEFVPDDNLIGVSALTERRVGGVNEFDDSIRLPMVTGEMSPYPTVARVTMLHHKALPNDIVGSNQAIPRELSTVRSMMRPSTRWRFSRCMKRHIRRHGTRMRMPPSRALVTSCRGFGLCVGVPPVWLKTLVDDSTIPPGKPIQLVGMSSCSISRMFVVPPAGGHEPAQKRPAEAGTTNPSSSAWRSTISGTAHGGDFYYAWAILCGACARSAPCCAGHVILHMERHQ